MKFTIENYEEYALDYLEGNLSEEDKNEYTSFLLLHPKINESFEDFQMVTLPESQLTFPDKDKLFRNDLRRRKLMPLFFRAVAAAILVLLLFNLWINRDQNKFQDQIVKIDDRHEKIMDLSLEEESTSKKDVQESEGDVVQTPEIIPDPAVEKELERILPEITLTRASTKPAESKANKDELAADLNYSENYKAENTVLIQPVVFIQKIDIYPEIALNYQIEHRPTYLIIEDEKKEDAVSKIGRLLAKANLIPTGLTDEINDIDIREKIIPESYIDLK